MEVSSTTPTRLFFPKPAMTNNASKKRKADGDERETVKRNKLSSDASRDISRKELEGSKSANTDPSSSTNSSHRPPLAQPQTSPRQSASSIVKGKGKQKVTAMQTSADKASPAKSKHRIKKLAPPRPFPTVPTSVSATGPRSAHKEGKNYICITRKTPLGAYLRRSKELILKDGYVRTLITLD